MAYGSKDARLALAFQRAHITVDSRTRQLEFERRRLRELEEAILVCEKNLNARQKRANQNAGVSAMHSAQAGQQKSITYDEKKIQANAFAKSKLCENLVRQLNILHRTETELIQTINATRQERVQVNQAFKTLRQEIKSQKREFLRQSQVLQAANLESSTLLAQAKAVSSRVQGQRHKLMDIVNDVQDDYNRQNMLLKSMDLAQKQSLSFQKSPKKNEGHSPKSGSEGETSRNASPNINNKQLALTHNRDDNMIGHALGQDESKVNMKQLCRRVFQLAFFNAIQRRRIKKYTRAIEIFEQATETIHLLTGIDSLDEIVRIFSTMEDRSFSLMTYVSSAYSDIEQLQIENVKLLNSIESWSTYGLNDRDLTRKQQLVNSVDLRTRVEESAVLDKENDIQRSNDMVEKARQSLIATIEIMRQYLPKLMPSDISIHSSNNSANGSPGYQYGQNNQLCSILGTESQCQSVSASDVNQTSQINNSVSNNSPQNSALTNNESNTVICSGNSPISDNQSAKPRIPGSPRGDNNNTNTTNVTIVSNTQNKTSSSDANLNPVVALARKLWRNPVMEKPDEATTTELLTYLEEALLDFREFLVPHGATSGLGGSGLNKYSTNIKRPTVMMSSPGNFGSGYGYHRGLGGGTKRPVDLPHVRIEESDNSDPGEEQPLSRAELQQVVKKSLLQRRRRK